MSFIGPNFFILSKVLEGGVEDFGLDEPKAKRLVQGMLDHQNKMELLFLLDPAGERKTLVSNLVRTLVTFGDSPDYLRSVVIPFLTWLGLDDLDRGTMRRVRNKLIDLVGTAPGFLENLVSNLNRNDVMSDESNHFVVAWFLDSFLLLPERVNDDAANETILEFAKKILSSSLDHPRCKSIALRIVALLDPSSLPQASEPLHKRNARQVSSLASTTAHYPGGRHDNDHTDFRKVSIVPSVEEVLSSEIPYLPTARDDCPLLDREFRIFRHDLVLSFKEAVESVPAHITINKDGSTTPAKIDSSKRSRKALILEFASPQGLLFNSHDEPSFRFSFRFAASHPVAAMKKKIQREDYFENDHGKKQLSRGTLAYIALMSDLMRPLVIGEISWRESDALGADTPSIGFEFVTTDALHRALALMVSPPSTPLAIVSLRVALFSFSPVLKRMQSLGIVPFPDVLDDQRDMICPRAAFADDFRDHADKCALISSMKLY